MNLSRKASTGLLLGMFLVAFLLRAYRPLSRPEQWLYRAGLWGEALETRDWTLTALGSSHTGFTVVFISGTAMQLYDAVKGTPGEAIFSWAVTPYTTDGGRKEAAGVMGLALVIAALIAAITLAVRRLGGWTLAVSVGGLLTFSPFYLAQSRALHLDALVSTLMLLSALLLLAYLESGQRRFFVLSGLAGGLALLTKVPSIFLLPFTGLALLVYAIKANRAGWRDHADGRMAWLGGIVGREVIGPLALWVVLAASPFALWPAMWVAPGDVFSRIFSRTSDHFTLGHDRRFFAGQVFNWDHPPLTFYPVHLVFLTSFVTLVLFAVATGLYLFRRRRGELPVRPVVFWLLAAYVFFFTAQMTIGASQVSRYILPALLMMVVMAAVGLVGVVGALRRALDGEDARKGWLPAAVVGAVVGLQALVVLPYAPNYGAHHNHLLGGNRTAINWVELAEHTEGIMYVAEFLNSQPDPESLRVAIPRPLHSFLGRYFTGQIVNEMSAEDDYHIFTVRHIQRQHNTKDWLHAWEAYAGSQPQLLVVFDGVPYMWVYATRPPESYEPIVIRRGGGEVFTVLAWVFAAVVAGVAGAGVNRPEVADASPSQKRDYPPGSQREGARA